MNFDLYFAGTQKKSVMNFIRDNEMPKLYSYVDDKKLINEYRVGGDKRGKLFIDSGAFSVAHSGIEVNIDEYIKYINETDRVAIFAQLDIIPFPVLNTETAKDSAERSWANYCYMMERVLPERRDSVIPVFHFGEDIKYLEQILNTEHYGKLPPYIGIGGRHGVSTEAQRQYFRSIFEVVKKSKNPNVKIHAFGMTTLSLLEEFPFTSADSTSWLKTAVYGSIMTKDFGLVNVSDKSAGKMNNIHTASPHMTECLLKEIERKGFTLDGLKAKYEDRLLYNIVTMREWAETYKCTYDTSFKTKKLF
jgi:hypothetical protein